MLAQNPKHKDSIFSISEARIHFFFWQNKGKEVATRTATLQEILKETWNSKGKAYTRGEICFSTKHWRVGHSKSLCGGSHENDPIGLYI